MALPSFITVICIPYKAVVEDIQELSFHFCHLMPSFDKLLRLTETSLSPCPTSDFNVCTAPFVFLFVGLSCVDSHQDFFFHIREITVEIVKMTLNACHRISTLYPP